MAKRLMKYILWGIFLIAAFPAALRSLSAYHPTVTHAGDLHSGPLVLHLWVIRLGVFYHPPARSG